MHVSGALALVTVTALACACGGRVAAPEATCSGSAAGVTWTYDLAGGEACARFGGSPATCVPCPPVGPSPALPRCVLTWDPGGDNEWFVGWDAPAGRAVVSDGSVVTEVACDGT